MDPGGCWGRSNQEITSCPLMPPASMQIRVCVCVYERYRDTEMLEIEAGREKQKETDQGVRAVWACLSVSLYMTPYDSFLVRDTS